MKYGLISRGSLLIPTISRGDFAMIAFGNGNFGRYFIERSGWFHLQFVPINGLQKIMKSKLK